MLVLSAVCYLILTVFHNLNLRLMQLKIATSKSVATLTQKQQTAIKGGTRNEIIIEDLTMT